MILVTGATGYIGGRLLARLEADGLQARCLTRRPAALRGRVAASTEVVEGDARDPAAVARALRGVSEAYYLVHSMGSTGPFADEDRAAAEIFAAAAADEGVGRVIYLGGLGSGPDLSEHLESRQEVGRILRAAPTPAVELRASIVIGAGSLSFEMVRSLVRRLPVMLTPQWVHTLSQPIAVDDVVEYLVAARTIPLPASRIYEIGGPERVSYAELMLAYARNRGLRRVLIPVPVLTPRLSSLWLGLVTPLYARVGRKLVDSVRNETTVTDTTALHDFPQIRPMGVAEAIASAVEEAEAPRTRWTDALSSAGRLMTPRGRPLRKQIVDSRWVRVAVTPERAFEAIQRIGGATGWYYADRLWRVRGFADLLVGGVGMRRGRRHPVDITPGDALDFWRVEAFEPGRLLRLRAEMKVPGSAWLQFRVESDGDGAVIRQTAFFDPKGVAGRIYWWVLAPAHQLVFPGMLRRIAAAAER